MNENNFNSNKAINNVQSENKVIAGRPIPPRPFPPRGEFVQKPKEEQKGREPLNDQSKGLLFGLLAGFFLLGGLVMLALMFIL